MNVTIFTVFRTLDEVMEALNKMIGEESDTPVNPFKVGQKVKITGTYMDCTEHLDGEIATILEVRDNDCLVKPNNDALTWWVWNENMEVVENV